MTENVGGIQYTVDADTSGIIKAETVVEKSNASMVNSFKSLDKQATTSAKKLNTEMTKATAGVKKGVQANLGQAGIQVQQFVGQLQGGQSAMVALAQQSADLGIVLGAPLVGVIVSLGAVLAGTLAPAIFGTVSNIEKLEKAIENTKTIMTVGAAGIVEYTDEMKRLNTASETLAKIKIALAMTQNAEAIKSAKKEASSLRAELFGFQETARDAAERLTGIGDNAGQIRNVALAMRDFNAAASDDKKIKALDSAEKALLSLSKDGVFPTKALADYAQEFFTLSDAVRQAITNNKALKQSQEDIADSNSVTEESFNDMKNAMIGANIALQSGERAALKWSLLLKGLDADQQAQILRLYDKKVALEAEQEATKKSAEENEKYEKSIESVNDQLDALFEKETRDSTLKDQKATATLTTQVQSVGLTPEEEIQARYDRELELLQKAEEKKIEIEGTYADRRKQLEVERLEAMRALNEESTGFLSDAFESLETQIAGTMAQVVVGAKDGREALSALANTILTQVIGSIVQWGIAEVSKLFTVESAEKGIQAANAAATTASVSAQVGMNTALAAQNAFMSTLAIPIVGPALAPAAAASAAAISGSLGASAVPLAPLAGAREFGGPVTNGKSYLVGERGPEIFTPNSAGGITSNKDMMSAGNSSQENINVNFNMTDTSDSSFQQQVYRNADLFVSIIRSYKNNQGESF